LAENQSNYEKILEYKVETSADFDFSRDVATTIFYLWQDPIISSLLDHESEFYLMDSAS
jgi:guanine nucleotide-binding protein subunit alpha